MAPMRSASATQATQRFSPRAIGDGLVLLYVGVLLGGAGFFGLAACGGMLWHREAFRVVSAVLWLLAIVAPSSLLPSWQRRLLFAGAAPLAYLALEAAVATFYPGPPESLADFGARFLQTLEFAPCR